MNSIQRRTLKLEEKTFFRKKMNEEKAKFLDFDNTLMIMLKRADYPESGVGVYRKSFKEERLGLCSSLFSELELEIKTAVINYKKFRGLDEVYYAEVRWSWEYVGSKGSNGNSYRLYSLNPFIGIPVWVTDPGDLI